MLPCQAAKAMTVCPLGSVYTSGPPGPDMPGAEPSKGSGVDGSVHAAEGPLGQVAHPMA